MNNTSSNIELQSIKLAESVNCCEIDPTLVQDFGYSEDYHILAEAIVEPKDMPEEYMMFLEEDPQNWMNWVCTIIGDEYRPIVKYIIENGY